MNLTMTCALFFCSIICRSTHNVKTFLFQHKQDKNPAAPSCLIIIIIIIAIPSPEYLLRFECSSLIPQILKQRSAQIPFPETRQYQHNSLPSILRPFPHLNRRTHRRAARNTAKDSLLRRKSPRHGHGILARNLHHLIQKRRVGIARDESGADALNFVRTGLPPRKHGRFDGLHGDEFHVGIARFEVLSASREGASRAHAAEEDVHLAVGVFPNFRTGRFAMDLRVVGIVELLEEESIGTEGVDDFFGLGDGASHALGSGREFDIGTKGLEEDTTFHGHGFRHGEDEFVSLGGGHHGKADAGVAGGGFHEDGFARGDVTASFGLVDHAEGDAILDRVGRVGGFELGDDFGAAFGGDLGDFDEGGATNEFEDVFGNFRSGCCVKLGGCPAGRAMVEWGECMGCPEESRGE
mmetsp:Transcript_2906/g.5364  ORF Transcript_2906/g.5364 Transcript_2906/m.5364 type:complete len:409 (+) Transcript_2906:152-1378(+)